MAMTDHHEWLAGQIQSTKSSLSKSQPSRFPDFQLERSRSHQITSSSPLTLRPSTSKSSHRRKQKEVGSPNLSHVPCKFFKQGTCTAGANCIFSHNPDPNSESSVCKYFLKGNCKFGAKCALLHTMSQYGESRKQTHNSQSQQQQPQQLQQQQPQQQKQQQQQQQQQSLPHLPPQPQRLASSCSSSLQHAPFQQIHASPPRSTFSHLTAAINRHHDPFSSSIPSSSSFASLFEEQQPFFHHSSPHHQQLLQQQPQQSRSSGSMFHAVNSLRVSQSPREDHVGSPFQRSYLTPSATGGAISPCSFPRTVQTGGKNYLDIPSNFYSNSDTLCDTDDLNDAMLPSSLNDLLTPTELKQRRTREQSQAIASFSPQREQRRHWKDGTTHSPLDGWTLRDADEEDEQEEPITTTNKLKACAIAIPGNHSIANRPNPLQDYHRPNTLSSAPDDDEPFYMESPDDSITVDPRTFAFPSLVSLPTKSGI